MGNLLRTICCYSRNTTSAFRRFTSALLAFRLSWVLPRYFWYYNRFYHSQVRFPFFILSLTKYLYSLSIAIFAATPPEKAGVVGSIFNCFLQLGCAAGTAIITSIQTSVDASHGGPTVWAGRAAGLWFLFGLLAIETLCIMVFMHNTMSPTSHEIQEKDKAKDTPNVEY